MYKKVKEGGRDVPNLSLKLDCFLSTQICKNLLKGINHKCFFFIRFWLGDFLRKWVGWDNKIPHAVEKPEVYNHVMYFLRVHMHVLNEELLCDHRKLYEIIRRVREVNVGVEMRLIKWEKIQSKRLGNEIKDLTWLVALNRLPVRDTLHRHGYAPVGECPRRGCGQKETIIHVFWECVFAQRFWEKGMNLFKLFLGDCPIDAEGVINGNKIVDLPIEKFVPVWTMICLGKSILWEKRNVTVQGKDVNCGSLFVLCRGN